MKQTPPGQATSEPAQQVSAEASESVSAGMRARNPEPDCRDELAGEFHSIGPKEGCARDTAPSRNIVWPLLIAAVLTLFFLNFPTVPPQTELHAYEADPSLGAILNYAHQSGLQFGAQFVYTYGPLGYLIFPYFYPRAEVLPMAVAVVLCFTVAAGLCLAAWQLQPMWRWVSLAGFAWTAANIELRTDLVINIGLLCWGLLCFAQSGRRLTISVLAFTALSVFVALAKISFLVIAGASVLALGIDLMLRGKRPLGVGLLLGFTGGFLAGWLISGQQLANLGVFIGNAVVMIRGYNAALGWEALPEARNGGVALALGVLALVVVRALSAFEKSEGQLILRRVILFAWVSGLSFTVWKHGFVRGYAPDVVACLGFVPVLALVLDILPCAQPVIRGRARVLGAVCGLFAAVLLQLLWTSSFLDSLQEPFRSFTSNLHWLVQPAQYLRAMNERIALNRRQAQLPHLRELVGHSTVDLFGRRQAYALFNDFNYRPRPAPQSYAVCNAQLMRLNEQFYLSPGAPEFVFFELASLDRKLPALEDAWTLRALLTNYQPIGAEGRFLLLKAGPARPPRLTLLCEANVAQGQPMDLRPYGDADLWMELALEPTWFGRLRQFFYRPPVVRIAAWQEPGKNLLVRNRAPASMLAAGFLGSPLLMNNDDVLDLFSSGPVKRPGAYSVELLPGEGHFWRPNIHLRIYRIENRLGRCVSAAVAQQWRQSSASAATPAAQAGSTPDTQVAKLSARPEPRPFTLFRNRPWHPTRPAPGRLVETLTFGVFLALPMACITLLAQFAGRMQRRHRPVGMGSLVLGNSLVLLCFLSLLLLGGEIYFRFIYDTTDSLGYTKVCEHWVQRHWRLNAAGCRDDVEYTAAIAPGKRRVSFIGDSFAAGHGIKNVEDRFENQLRSSHPQWEIHVLANVGLDTGSEQVLLNRALAKGYQLDQVILVYCLNDVGDLMPEEGQAYEQIFADLDRGGWFVRHSYFINLFYHRYMARRIPLLQNYFPFVRSAYSDERWERQKQRLKEFHDVVQAHGGRLAVMTFPFLNALGPHYEYQFIHDELDRFWRGLDVPHLDLLSLYKDLPPRKLTVNPYDAHPNEYANQLAAQALEKFLPEAMSRP